MDRQYRHAWWSLTRCCDRSFASDYDFNLDWGGEMRKKLKIFEFQQNFSKKFWLSIFQCVLWLCWYINFWIYNKFQKKGNKVKVKEQATGILPKKINLLATSSVYPKQYLFSSSRIISDNTVATLSTTVILVYPNTSNIIQFNSTSASSHQSHFAPYANFQALFFLERSACYSA